MQDTKEDFSKNGESYDIIFDTVGKSPYWSNLKSLKNKGKLLLSAAGLSQMIFGLWTSLFNNLPGRRNTGKQVVSGVMAESSEDVQFFNNLIEKGEIKPVIDRIYPFERIADAHYYAEKGHKKGNVVIKIN